MILTSPTPGSKRILRLHHVIEKVVQSKSFFYCLMGLGLFPACIKIGIKAVRWLQTETELWFTEREIFAISVDVLLGVGNLANCPSGMCQKNGISLMV